MQVGLRRVRAHASATLLAAGAALLAGCTATAHPADLVSAALALACLLALAGAVVTWRSGEHYGELVLAGLVVVTIGLITLAAAVSQSGSADLVVLFLLPAIFGACFLALAPSIVVLAISSAALGWLDMRYPATAVAPTHWAAATLVLASAAAAVWVLRRQLTSAHEELARLATCDPLTGLLNRRGFDQRVEHEIERHHRAGDPFVILLCDLDHFKTINDRHGHAAGDRVLARVAATLMNGARSIDAVARVGGEEIALLLVHCDRASADVVAERLRLAVAEPCPGEPSVTISIGIAQAGPTEVAEALLARADAVLYEAKRAGRNCIRAAADPSTGGPPPLGLVA
jgi:diguanylate cyclase (GGDEF)-like protein